MRKIICAFYLILNISVFSQNYDLIEVKTDKAINYISTESNVVYTSKYVKKGVNDSSLICNSLLVLRRLNCNIDEGLYIGTLSKYKEILQGSMFSDNIIYFDTREELYTNLSMLSCIYEDYIYITSTEVKFVHRFYEIKNLSDYDCGVYYQTIVDTTNDKVKKHLKDFYATNDYKILVDRNEYKKYNNSLTIGYSYLIMLFVLFFCLLTIFITYKTLKYNHLNLQSLLNFLIGLSITYIANMFLFQSVSDYIRILGMIIVSEGSHKYIQKYYNNHITMFIYSVSLFICTILALTFKEVYFIYISILIIIIYFLIITSFKLSKKNIIGFIVGIFYFIFSVLTGLARFGKIIYHDYFLVFFVIAFSLQIIDSFFIQKRRRNLK